jgi:hypothetical protein
MSSQFDRLMRLMVSEAGKADLRKQRMPAVRDMTEQEARCR